MALIVCPECGQQVSNMAEICPHCGIKIAGQDIPQIPWPGPSVPAGGIQTSDSPAMAADKQDGSEQESKNSATVKQEERKKSGVSLGTWAFCFLLMSAVCGVGYYYYNDAQTQREQADYENAMHSGDTMVMQAYLAHYPDAPIAHRDSVRVRMGRVRGEQNEWQTALRSDSKKVLQTYIDTHPDSEHMTEARNMIDSIDYSVAVHSNTLEGYKTYLAQHPDGQHAAEAQEAVKSRQTNEITAEDMAFARRSFRKFFQAVNSHDEKKLLQTVAERLDTFLGKINADGEDVVTFMNKLYKQDVTNLNWYLLDDFRVEKVKAADGESVNLKVNFGARLKLDRTDKSKESEALYAIEGELTPDGLITKLSMRKKAR